MAKATKTNYVAKLDGEIIGTRSSPRVYTHAVIIQYSEQHYRDEAYTFNADKQDRKNFDHYVQQAAGKSPYDWCRTPEKIAEAQADVEGGFDAYCARLRQRQIDSFEAGLKAGGYTPGIVGWCGRRDLAEKLANQYRGQARVAKVWIVEAEVAAKPVKMDERKHHAYGPRA